MRNVKLIAALITLSTIVGNTVDAQTLTVNCTDNSGSLEIDLAASGVVDIAPDSGNVTAEAADTFSCTLTSGVDVSMDAADGGFLTVNGGTIIEVVENSAVTFRWGSRGAWSCTGTGDLAGTDWNLAGKLPNGEQQVVLTGITPGQYQAGLTCENGGVTAFADEVTVEVASSSLEIPPGCEGRQPGSMSVAEECRFGAAGAAVDCRSYASLFGGQFPGTQQAKDFIQPANNYTVLEFSTANLTRDNGSWTWNVPQFGLRTTGPRIMSISKCPADFSQTEIAQDDAFGMGDSDCYKRPANQFDELKWFRTGTQDNGGCELELDETYYYNILYTNDPGGTSPAELTWGCGVNDGAEDCHNGVAPVFQ